MKSASPQTRVSEYFGLKRDQATLDFVDVTLGTDTRVCVDPSRLRSIESTWTSECNSLMQHFFEQALECVRKNDKKRGMELLSELSEGNEFHLGFSRKESRGNGLGQMYADDLWDALVRSKAGETGLLQDLEDTCLFVEGIGPDRISDATCNIIRGPLIKYTQDICAYYDIPVVENVESGPVWNAGTGEWEDDLVRLPVGPFGKIILVPKIIVRHRLTYSHENFQRHYLLPLMQQHEIAIRSSLVQILKDGRARVTKVSLGEKYGVDKLSTVQQTTKHPDALKNYRSAAGKRATPLSHEQIAEIEETPAPDLQKLLEDVISLPAGPAHADDYEKRIEALLTAVLYPSLAYPEKQHKIHGGRKRIDLKYTNVAKTGFFNWLSSNFSAAHIFVECKNYGKEIGNPEVDQLAGRFGPSRGQVGILVCRSVQDSLTLSRRCRDTALDHRGFIIHLTDDDLVSLVKAYIGSGGTSAYPVLRDRFSFLMT